MTLKQFSIGTFFIILTLIVLLMLYGFRMHDKALLAGASIADDDVLMIEDLSASNATKHITFSGLKTYLDSDNVYRPGGTDVAIADGGMGSSTAVAAKAALDTGLPSENFVVSAAKTTTDFLVWRAPVAITITDIYGISQSGVSIVGGLDECNSTGLNPVAVDADITFDGGLDQDDGALTNGTIAAGNWVKWHTTSTDTPGYGYLTITFDFTID